MSGNRIYQPITDATAQLLFKVKVTTLKMLRMRGFDISDETYLLDPLQTWKQFKTAYSEAARLNHSSVRSVMTSLRKVGNAVEFFDDPKVYTKAIDNTTCIVYFADMDGLSLGLEEFDSFVEMVKEIRPDTSILISPGKLSKPAKNKLDTTNYWIQVFKQIELVIDPTEHWLVPKHEILSLEEVKTIFPANFNMDDLPVIKQSDPISKYLGAKQGDVLRIYRFNMGSLYGTSDVSTFTRKYIAFRLVRQLDLKHIVLEDEDEESTPAGTLGTDENANVHEL